MLTCVGIDNTNETFPFLLVYIVSESADIFRFVNNVLAELIFYNISGPAVCIGDFATSFQSAMFYFNKQKIMAAVETKQDAELCQLQACIWHAVEIVKAKLVKAGRYMKERRNEFTEMIWTWTQLEIFIAADENKQKLFTQFDFEEQQYFKKYYEFKEHQFVIAHTKTYLNLSCNSMQQTKKHHLVLKAVCDCTKLLSSAV